MSTLNAPTVKVVASGTSTTDLAVHRAHDMPDSEISTHDAASRQREMSDTRLSQDQMAMSKRKTLGEQGRSVTYRGLMPDKTHILCLDLINPDLNDDGVIDEHEAQVYQILKNADENKDGYLSIVELYSALRTLVDHQRSKSFYKQAFTYATIIIFIMVSLNALLVCLAIWGFKDSYVNDGNDHTTSVFTDRGLENIVAVASALYNVPMYVAPILPDDQLDQIRKVTFSYYDSSANVTVRQTASVVSVTRYSRVWAEMTISYASPHRALVIRDGVANHVVGSRAFRICASNAECSSFKVSSGQDADELIAAADAALAEEGVTIDDDDDDFFTNATTDNGASRRRLSVTDSAESCETEPLPEVTAAYIAVDVSTASSNTPIAADQVANYDDLDRQCLPNTGRAGIQCCQKNNGKCKKQICSGSTFTADNQPVIGYAATYDEAVAECAAINRRVCTEDELRNPNCKFSRNWVDKCGMKNNLVWTKETCSLPPPAPAPPAGSLIFASPPPGPAEPPPIPPAPPVVYTTIDRPTTFPASVAAGPVKLPESEPGEVLVLSRVETVGPSPPPQYFSVIGGQCGAASADISSSCPDAAGVAAIRCCEAAADTCFDSICTSAVNGNYYLDPISGDFSGAAVTYQQAETECEARGKRLCTKAELEGGVCCGTGCGYDRALVWSSTSCSPPPIYSFKPAVRSYDGHPWEGVKPLSLAVDCTHPDGCVVVLPAADHGYELQSHNGTALDEEEAAVRLLTQGTYGPTRDSVAAVLAAQQTAEQWVAEQMNVSIHPPTLHRVYLRQRSTPAIEADVHSGRIRPPCDAGSRWERFTFEVFDEQRLLTIASDGLYVDGELRTEIVPEGAPAEGTYHICDVWQRMGVNSTVKLTPKTDNSVAKNCDVNLLNPPVSFSSPPAASHDLAGTGAALVSLQYEADVKILDTTLTTCDPTYQTKYLIDSDGLYYRHDRRLEVLTNTLEAPTTLVGDPSAGICPNTPRTFLNEDSCVHSSGCAALVYTDVSLTLDLQLLEDYYFRAGKILYRIDGLENEGTGFNSPCTGASRWRRLGTGTCEETAGLDATSKALIVDALSTSSDTNAYVRDVEFEGSCTAEDAGDATTAKKAVVLADGECWQHVHHDTQNVYDFTWWAQQLNLARDEKKRGNPNPGLVWTRPEYNFTMQWPSDNWGVDEHQFFQLLGRFGDTVKFNDLPVTAQAPEIAAVIGAVGTRPSFEGGVACGSPGEVANVPSLGHKLNVFVIGNKVDEDRNDELVQDKYDRANGKNMVWTAIAMGATDQLRQRVAWALSQIYVINRVSIEQSNKVEAWVTYYDAFVRHAFGNLRDVIREVSYSPMMGEMLTFVGSKSFAADGTYPDENFARELMQLFTIGLFHLNQDGTAELDADGQLIPTYDNSHIINFARCWTGFKRQPNSNAPFEGRDNERSHREFRETRVNVENRQGGARQNDIDPMDIDVEDRDPFPKLDLSGTYLGDAYPLCSELPSRPFLRTGARYRYLGVSPHGLPRHPARLTNLPQTKVPEWDEALPLAETSALYALLCDRTATDAACSFPMHVELSTPIQCSTSDGECASDALREVSLFDVVANLTVHYEYIRPACVELSFFSGGRLVQDGSRNGNARCADPATAAAGAVCCTSGNPAAQCEHKGELVTFDTASVRCAATSTNLCVTNPRHVMGCDEDIADYRAWTLSGCNVLVQVYSNGNVGIVHSATKDARFKEDSGNAFAVIWDQGVYPTPESGCAGSPRCTLRDSVGLLSASCLCVVDIETTTAVFSGGANGDEIPSLEQVEAQLFIGAAPPSMHTTGIYSQGATEAGVTVHLKNGVWDAETIFEVSRWGRSVYLANKKCVLRVGGISGGESSFSLRNPPHFVSFTAPHVRDAAYETEALIDHLFYHDSHAPFICAQLIQRLTTSNPSPRYIKAVVDAFTTGTYSGITYSGSYGDLGAAVAAVMLDREARSDALLADPAYGSMREPLLMVTHLLRALEYEPRDNYEIELHNLVEKIGEQPYESPGVFNFYLPDFVPLGPVDVAGLVSPEAQLNTAGYSIGFLNGVTSLVTNGLTHCDKGWGLGSNPSSDYYCKNSDRMASQVEGALTYAPSGSTATEVVRELNVLLTGGRLEDVAAYEAAYSAASDADQALKTVMQMMAASAEFHVTNLNTPTTAEFPPIEEIQSLGRSYKAVVIMFMRGGCDTFNLLVPHSECQERNGIDLHQEYINTRTPVGVPKNKLLEIDTAAQGQPCDKFGLHENVPYLRDLYANGDGAFVSNIGTLIEPITKEDYQSSCKKNCASIPPLLFSHNWQQRQAKSLHAQDYNAKGLLGRMVDAVTLQDSPYKAGSYTLGGADKIVEASGPHSQPVQIDPSTGTVEWGADEAIVEAVRSIKQTQPASIFSDTYDYTLLKTLNDSHKLQSILGSITPNQTFPHEAASVAGYKGSKKFSQQLYQVARLMKAREQLQEERQVFYVELSGFDAHNGLGALPDQFYDINHGLHAFIEELKLMGVWNDTTIISQSDFGRTLTSNGRGTDHGWGGNHFVLGGSVNGGQVFGRYPDDLFPGGNYSDSRGRVMPTTSWDQLFNAVVDWFGVHPDYKASVLPNLNNFPHEGRIHETQLYD